MSQRERTMLDATPAISPRMSINARPVAYPVADENVHQAWFLRVEYILGSYKYLSHGPVTRPQG
jgi:hypothetical protein